MSKAVPGFTTHLNSLFPPNDPSHPFPIVPLLQHKPSVPHHLHLPCFVLHLFQQFSPECSNGAIDWVDENVTILYSKILIVKSSEISKEKAILVVEWIITLELLLW